MLFLISLSHTPKENHKPRCHKTIFLIYTNKQSDHNKYFFDDFFSSFCFFATDDLALIWVCTSSCSWAKKAVDDEDTFPFLSCNLKELKWKTKYKINKIYTHTHKLGLIFAANFPAMMLLSTFDLSLYLSQIYVQHLCTLFNKCMMFWVVAMQIAYMLPTTLISCCTQLSFSERMRVKDKCLCLRSLHNVKVVLLHL